MPLLHFGKKRRKSVVPMPHAVEMLAQMSNAIASEEASNAVAPRPWRHNIAVFGDVIGQNARSRTRRRAWDDDWPCFWRLARWR